MALAPHDAELRAAALAHVDAAKRKHGPVLQWRILKDEFYFRGQRVPLVAPSRGIHKPRLLDEAALTIITTPSKPGRPQPYDDSFDANGRLLYAYQDGSGAERANHQVRMALRYRLPLIHLFGVSKGRYHVEAPVFIVADDPGARMFTVEVGLRGRDKVGLGYAADLGRRYAHSNVRRRLHQSAFRESILRAYAHRCSICRLRRIELLEAAHIVPDREDDGVPTVQNGLSLCRIHHGAFDRMLIGVRPDLVVEVRRDLLEEEDGPMLEQLKQSHGQPLEVLPRRVSERPEVWRLERRFEEFRSAH